MAVSRTAASLRGVNGVPRQALVVARGRPTQEVDGNSCGEVRQCQRFAEVITAEKNRYLRMIGLKAQSSAF